MTGIPPRCWPTSSPWAITRPGRCYEVSYCYLGDGRDAAASSLLVTGAMLGMDVRICAPEPLQPSVQVQDIAAKLAARLRGPGRGHRGHRGGGRGRGLPVRRRLAAGGRPADDGDERIDLLLPYQVNQGVLTATGNPAVKFMHGLPAVHNRETVIGQRLQRRRGLQALEVTEEVFESPASIVFDQAENRLHTIKAVMVATAGDAG